MKIFSTDIPNDRNMYGDNIATKRDDYVIVPETIRDINVLWHDVQKGVFRTQSQTLQ